MLDLTTSLATVTEWTSPEFDGSQGTCPAATPTSARSPRRGTSGRPPGHQTIPRSTSQTPALTPRNVPESAPRMGLCDAVAAFPPGACLDAAQMGRVLRVRLVLQCGCRQHCPFMLPGTRAGLTTRTAVTMPVLTRYPTAACRASARTTDRSGPTRAVRRAIACCGRTQTTCWSAARACGSPAATDSARRNAAAPAGTPTSVSSLTGRTRDRTLPASIAQRESARRTRPRADLIRSTLPACGLPWPPRWCGHRRGSGLAR